MSKKLIFFGVLLLSVMLVLAACGSPAPGAHPSLQRNPPRRRSNRPSRPSRRRCRSPLKRPWSFRTWMRLWLLVTPMRRPWPLTTGMRPIRQKFLPPVHAATLRPVSRNLCRLARSPRVFLLRRARWQCETCHNASASEWCPSPSRRARLSTLPSEGEALCMTCHQGRESKVSVDKQIATFKVTDDVDTVVAARGDQRRNEHLRLPQHPLLRRRRYPVWLQAQGGYEYDGKVYDPKFRHVEGMDTCVACHDQHATQVRVEKCQECHTDVKTVDDLKNVRMQGSSGGLQRQRRCQGRHGRRTRGLQDILYSCDPDVCQGSGQTPDRLRSGDLSVLVLWLATDGKADKDDKGVPSATTSGRPAC